MWLLPSVEERILCIQAYENEFLRNDVNYIFLNNYRSKHLFSFTCQTISSRTIQIGMGPNVVHVHVNQSIVIKSIVLNLLNYATYECIDTIKSFDNTWVH